jgi:hypothetical protein
MSNVSNVQTYAYTAETGIIPYTSVPDLLKQAAIECPDINACISCTVNRERTFITFSELYEIMGRFTVAESPFTTKSLCP